MRWDYKSPAPQQIVSDGTSLWVYTPELNQVNKGNAPKALAGPAGSFLSGLGKLREEFTVRFLNPASPRDGAGRPVLDLTPKQPTPLLTRLVITVDPKDYVVRQAVLYDQFQNTVTMTFNKVAINPGLSDTLFVFTPPKDAAVVPLDPTLAEDLAMAAENSFDVACKIDMQEVTNAIDQARRDIATRYDLKGAKNEIEIEKMDIMISSTDDMKVKAVLDILQSKLHRRGIDLKALTINDPGAGGRRDRAPEDHAAGRRADGEGQGDRAPDQGLQDPRPGLHPGEAGAGLGQEPRRPAGDHRAAQGQGSGHRAPVHELPLHVDPSA